jgi:hypothetical protein
MVESFPAGPIQEQWRWVFFNSLFCGGEMKGIVKRHPKYYF